MASRNSPQFLRFAQIMRSIPVHSVRLTLAAGRDSLGALMTAHDLTHPAERLVQAMARIDRYRMATSSGGNLSIRDEELIEAFLK